MSVRTTSKMEIAGGHYVKMMMMMMMMMALQD
jgi:hypothetical protein